MRYYRVKQRYGEHAAALLVFATGMGVIALALAVWVLGAEWGLNNPGSKALAALFFGGLIAFMIWRPDVEFGGESEEQRLQREWVRRTSPAYSYLPYNINHDDYWDR